MKTLRGIRILLAVLFFAATAACLIVGPQIHPMARAAQSAQIVLSAASITIGATLVWLLLTFLFGRIYCATVCPVGTFSDIFFRIRRRVPKLNKPFSYRHPSRAGVHILWVYVLCLLLGIVGVPYLIEPWNMARNLVSAVRPETTAETWGMLHTQIGLGVATGAVAGVVTAVLIALTSLWRGREFCSRYCPLGTAMGLMQGMTLYHIEIDPDRCTSCGRCEDICRSQCVKVVSRYVDDARCVRCFDCVAECPEGAIRFQANRNRRPASPLLRRKKMKV